MAKSLDGRAWVIKYGQFFQGRTEHCFSPDFPYQSLDDSIANAFCLSDELLVILEGYMMYVLKSFNYTWLFDSHARDLNGMPSETGAAVLICFSDLAEIVDHVRILATELHTKCYEVVCLHLSCIDCDGIRPNWKRDENIPNLQQTSVGQGSPSTTSPGTPIETWGIEGKVLSGACAPASTNHCTMKHDNAIELLQSNKLNSKSEFKGRSAMKQSMMLDHDGVGLSKTNLSDCVLRTVSKISIEHNYAVKCPNRPGCSKKRNRINYQKRKANENVEKKLYRLRKTQAYKKTTRACIKKTLACEKKTFACEKKTLACEKKTRACKKEILECKKKTPACKKKRQACIRKSQPCKNITETKKSSGDQKVPSGANNLLGPYKKRKLSLSKFQYLSQFNNRYGSARTKVGKEKYGLVSQKN